MNIDFNKIRHLSDGAPFKHSPSGHGNIFHLRALNGGWYEIYKNEEIQPDILVRFFNNKIIILNRDYYKGCINSLHLNDIKILEAEIILENNFIDGDEDYQASFDGMEVDLHEGKIPKPVKLYIEHNLF